MAEFDAALQSRLAAFQRAHGLPESTTVDATTWDALVGPTGAAPANTDGATPAWGGEGDEQRLSVYDGRYEWHVENPMPRDGSPGGWKWAESYAQFSTTAVVPRRVRIGFRVGVPMRSSQLGVITDDFATSAAIESCNAAGQALQAWLRAADPSGISPESVIVATFIRLMGEQMAVHIPGSRVTRVTIR